jgi:cytochrome c2
VQKKDYLKISKWFLLLFGAFLFMVYGFAVGRYQVFPFDLLYSLQETEEERLLASENFEYTRLQRLHINKVKVPEDVASGGAMTVAGTELFVVDRNGKVMAFDLEEFTKPEVQIPQIYLGLDQLEADGWNDRDLFDPTKVRVKGAYAEQDVDNRIDLYVSHHLYRDQCFVSLLSKIELQKTENGIESLGDWQELYRTSPCMNPDTDIYDSEDLSVKRWIFGGHISGGRIISYDENNLLLSIGDHFYDGYDKDAYAQENENSYGKFILIDKNTGESRIYAKGTRNAQGLFKDNNGTIWASEHGPDGGDELNIIKEGANYGWPEVTLGIQYHHNPWPGTSNQGRHEEFTAPIFAWSNTIAPSDLIRIEGDKFDIWKGDLVSGSLAGRALHRLRLSEDNSRVIYDEKIDLGHRIRNIILLHDSSILLRTDDNYLIHIDDAGPVYEEFNYDEFLSNNELARRFREFSPSEELSENQNEGLMAFTRSCGHCHNIEGSSITGPNLKDLANREVGAADDYNYTQVLANSNDTWDEESLKEYIVNPQSVYPGTSMGPVAVSDQELNSIVEFLLNQ